MDNEYDNTRVEERTLQNQASYISPYSPELRLPLPAPNAPIDDKEQPSIYVMVHCTKDGRPPTNREYMDCLRKMRSYTAYFDSPNNPLWTSCDKAALEIDSLPGLPPARDWTRDSDIWGVDDNGNTIKHPRRYARNKSQRSSICNFIVAMDDRLREIPQAMADEPLKWSLCYVGWSRTPEIRKVAQYTHSGNDCAVKK